MTASNRPYGPSERSEAVDPLHISLLWGLVDLLLLETVEHHYGGNVHAMWERLSPEGRVLLDAVAAVRSGS